jgi:hypothetical protein
MRERATREERILLVEDEEPIRDLVTTALRFTGFTVETAATGPEGLALARNDAWHVLVLDVNLPGLDGFSLQDFPALVANHWIRMATDAWIGYVSYGRGYVGLGEGVNFSYVPISMPALAASRNPEDRNIRDQCSRYNPKREVVVAGVFARNEQAFGAGTTEIIAFILAPRATKKVHATTSVRDLPKHARLGCCTADGNRCRRWVAPDITRSS